jgi:hypothetical protein
MNMDLSAPSVDEVVVSDYGSYGRYKTIDVRGVTDPAGVANVTIGVYSVDNGYDDWVKYPATYWNNNSWGIILDTANHKYTGGRYDVYVYTTDGLGNTGMVKYASFNVPYSNASAGSAYIDDYGGFFEFDAYGIDSNYGVKDVYFYVYTNDTNGKWYSPTFFSTRDFWYSFIQKSDYGSRDAINFYYFDVYIVDMRDSLEYVATYAGSV